MSNQAAQRNESDDREFLDSVDRKEADFFIDEPVQSLQPNDSLTLEHDASVSTEVDSAERKVPEYEPRRQTPSHILFLPNMASRTSEKELAEFADQLPCKVKKTFMYMSDVAYHGFIECFSVEQASQNLAHINSHTMEVKGKRVFAEYSRRKSVQDRRTYETRQHVRKERDGPRHHAREASPPGPPGPRRRSRTRSPARGYRPRSPPRGSRERYPPSRDYRDDYYRRDGPPAPPSRDYRYPPRHYEGPPPPAYRRDYDFRGADEYHRGYDAYPSRGYPRGHSPIPAYVDHPYDRHPPSSYAAPLQTAPAPPPARDPYLAHVPYGTSAPAPVSHPLLSMRPTSIGTGAQQTAPYHYHQYR